MPRPWNICRGLVAAGLLTAAACSGSINCSGCAGGPLDPIPGGFDPAAQISGAAQVRVSTRGLDFIEASFQDLMSAYVRMSCGTPADVPCPTDFVALPGGAPNPSSCDAGRGVCVEASGPGPLVGFEIEQTVSSGATVCRDAPSDPARRRCYAWLRFEGLGLQPRAPDAVDATINAQIVSTDIPFRYDALGMDCLVKINSGLGAAPTQDIVVAARLGEWAPPSGTGGRQLQISVDTVDAMIPDTDIDIRRDPVHGDLLDIALCGVANLGVVKNALVPRLVGSLTDIVRDEVGKALGWSCGQVGDQPCPMGTSCNADGFCAEADGDLVPNRLGFEGRLDFAALLGGLTGGRPGQGDISFLIGGQSRTDAQGLTVNALGGAEVVTPDPTCAQVLPSPRLRPGWTPPPAMPTGPLADLDFDGVAETPYMLAAGLSEAWLDQVIWSAYTTGLFCQRVSAQDLDLLNTGSLSLLMPSLSRLSHQDKYPDAIFPAAITVFPRGEPQLTLGSGKVDTSGGSPVLTNPLLDLFLDDLEVTFQAFIEERWVRLMTMTVDVHVGLGAVVTPANAIELVIGDLGMSVSDVRVTNSEILAESPADLADTIPSLLMLALPQLSSALPPFNLPSGMELGGFEIDVLGLRGVETSPGLFPHVGVYADLSFNPALAPALSLAADTDARLLSWSVPDAADLAAGRGGAPRALLALEGRAPAGEGLEYQVRLNGGLWSPFFQPEGGLLVVERAELRVEGRHRLEVRARVAGRYRTLDPTPVELDLVVDARPPVLEASLAPREGGIRVRAHDVVSRDRVRVELSVGGVWRDVVPDAEGLVAAPEIAADPSSEVVVRATDEQGRSSSKVLRAALAIDQGAGARAQQSQGCHCVERAARPGPGLLGILALAMLLLRLPRLTRR